MWPLHRQYRDLFKKKKLSNDERCVFVMDLLKLKYLKHYHKCCEMNWKLKIHLYKSYTYLSTAAETESELLQTGGSPSSD